MIQNDCRHRALAELKDDPDAILVRFVADVGKAIYPFIFDHVGNCSDPLCLVDLVREFGDNNAVTAVSPFALLNSGNPPDDHTTLPGGVDVPDTFGRPS